MTYDEKHASRRFEVRSTGSPSLDVGSRDVLESSVGYTCPSCFEQNYVGVDPSGGRRQRFIEDCPVCCRPIEFEIAIDREGDALVERAELAE